MAETLPLVRDFAVLDDSLTVDEARAIAPTGYVVIVDASGRAAGCLYELGWTARRWPDGSALARLRKRWQGPVLSEAQATGAGLAAIASFVGDDLGSAAGVVLVDDAGRPCAVLPRSELTDAAAKPRIVAPPSQDPGAAGAPNADSLMVTRYGHVRFPQQVGLHQAVALTVRINRERLPGVEGQVELGLTARSWPLHVRVSLVNVRPEDFLVAGPSAGSIFVQPMADSEPLTFTLVPQSLGSKKLRVRFEQDGMYLGTAVVSTGVVERPAAAPDAEVESMPTLTGRAVAPDLTIYVEQVADLVYSVRVRQRGDTEAREVDRIEFPRAPDDYLETLFADLNSATSGGLSPQEFDYEVEKLGSDLFAKLFREDGFKAFYWQSMHGAAAIETVLIVSDEPYIPWEILRPARELADGSWEVAPGFLCERFALARWLSGPGLVAQLPLHTVALVVPPSNLRYVSAEVAAIARLLQPLDQTIEDRMALVDLLRTKQAHVLHFACHGRYDMDRPGRSELVLGNRRFTPQDLNAQNRNFVRSQPLVFLNACDSGREGIGLTGVDGWASAFLRAGRPAGAAGSGDAGQPSRSYAGAFLGSVWQTTDELASLFAAEFYQHLLAGRTIGQAVRLARARVKRAGDATYLSYTLYANPGARGVRPVGG